MVFDSLVQLENSIDHFFTHQDRLQPIVFFGAGFALKRILPRFEKNGFFIGCVADSNPQKHGTFYDGRYRILPLGQTMSEFPNALYVISSPVYFHEIQKNLTRAIEKKRVCGIDFECGHYFSGTDFKSYLTKHLDRFEKVYISLDDDLSKKTYLNVIKAHLSGRREDFETAWWGKDDWYLFKSLLRPNAKTVYLDCGAYDGDTLLVFNAAAKNGYASIIAFEPDETVQEKLESVIRETNLSNVRVIQKGVYSSPGTVKFTLGGVYSTIANANKALQPQVQEVSVNVTTIDAILCGEFVDIIKMDIEGAEYNALLGAEATIKKYKPRLAICLYHNYEDFLRIPELILQMAPHYKLYIRHHSQSCTDTILYAIHP